MENHSLKLGDEAVILEPFQSLLDRVRNEGNHANQSSPSIYMAPSILRDLSPNSFKPQVVSIGPLHREDEGVQAFEKHKETYLIKLMSRIDSSLDEILKICMQKAYTSMNEIKACYVWTTLYNDAEIAKMMVMDACFILEFILKIRESDPFSRKSLLFQNVMRDLVLLENQIPFFFLDHIFQCTILKFKPDIGSLIEFIIPVLSCLNLFKQDIKTDNVSSDAIDHILGLLHQCYKPPDDITKDVFSSTIFTAVNLGRAGVNFEPNQNSNLTWVMGMEVKLYKFPCVSGSWRRCTLRMPVLHVQGFTESVLRNLIAYEQASRTGNYITSYVIAMDMLVNTQEDVTKLADSRVLINNMGSHEEIANMIKSLCKEVVYVEFFYEEQWKTLTKYCNCYWPKNIARMRRTYFSSPWNMIALLAGIILFALTVVQTIFAIKPTESK